jgi:hypothetical protein
MTATVGSFDHYPDADEAATDTLPLNAAPAGLSMGGTL